METARPLRWAPAVAVLLAGLLVVTGTAWSQEELPPGGTFTDDDGSVHEGSIEAIAAAGVTNGCEPERFCTDRILSRAEMAAFLSRALGLESGDDDWFTDDESHQFEAEINAIAAAGITLGCAEGSFCPDDTVPRSQMASFLARAFDTAPSDVDAFTDDDDSVHEEAINAIAAAGITTGCDEGLFCPTTRVRRDQMASFLARALELDPIVPPPRLPLLCRAEGATSPTGSFTVAEGGHAALPSEGRVYRYLVEVEDGLGIDPDCFAGAVELVLTDSVRGWGSAGTRSFERVDSGTVDFRVTLAFPSTTDSLCLPLDTGGIFSCWNGSRATINSWRWEFGADAYDDVRQYRIYVIGHEVGHALGFGHRSCPGAGEPSPVMMQQTKTVGTCLADPWPESYEL